MNRKSIMMGAAVLTLVGTTAFVSTAARAQTSGSDHYTNMIQKLAQKLGVTEDKVKIAMDEIHQERKSEIRANLEQKLNTLVSEGKITEDQKSALLVKIEDHRAKMEANKESFKNLSPEEIKSKMESERNELEAWAKSEGIDLSLLPVMKIKHLKMGPGHKDVFIEKFGATQTVQ